MSLRKKTMLGVLAGMLAAVMALWALFEWRVTGSFRDMERDLALSRLRLVEHLQQSALRELDAFALGYSDWRDTVALIDGRGAPELAEAYIAESFDPESMIDDDVDFLVLLDPENAPVLVHGRGVGGRAPAELERILRPGGVFVPAEADQGAGGLAMLGYTPYLVVSQPVTPPEAELRDTPRGRLVMGRALRGPTLERIGEMTGFPLLAIGADGVGMAREWEDAVPADLRQRLPEACAEAPKGRLVRILQDGRPVGGVALYDSDTGLPEMALWARLPATGLGTAERVRMFFLTALAALLLLMAAAFYLQIEFSLLRPLAAIQDALETINRTGDRALRVPRAGDAEFAAHADRVNATLDHLRAAEDDMARRLRIEEALAEAARLLLRGGPGVLTDCLRALGDKLDVDVVSYYALDPQGGDTMRCAGVFRDPSTGAYGGSYRFDAPVADWIAEASRARRPIVVADTARMPDGMEGVREFIQEYDLKSFLAMPTGGAAESGAGASGGSGVVGFGNVGRAHVWSAEDLRAIAMIAELLGFGLDARPRPSAPVPVPVPVPAPAQAPQAEAKP